MHPCVAHTVECIQNDCVCESSPELTDLTPAALGSSLCPPRCGGGWGSECPSGLLLHARNLAGALDSLPYLIVTTNLLSVTDEDPPEIKSPTHGADTAYRSQSED